VKTFEAIEKRASVRVFEDRLVPKELLEKLVDAGRRAPSARAVEPWEFIVVTEKKTLMHFGAMAGNSALIKGAAACVVIFCKDTKYYLEDGSAATENILLAATELGLGTCWVAGDKKDYAGEVAKVLSVPAEYKLISLVAVGWAGEETKQHKSRSLKEVLHWEKF